MRRVFLIISICLHLLLLLGLASLAVRSDVTPMTELTLVQTKAQQSAKSQALKLNKPARLMPQKTVPQPASATEPEAETVAVGTQAQSAQQRYILELVQVLNAKKIYPDLAKRLKQQGRVLVQFRLSREGRVMEAKILQKTAFEILNRSAQSLIEQLDGLKPFPQELKQNSWLFTVPIDYQVL